MRKLLIVLLSPIIVALGACSPGKSGDMIFVPGGAFINTKSNYYGKNEKIANFYIGRFEVTQKEWVELMGTNPSLFKGDDLPVDSVSWYDCVEYCNAKSAKEGLRPYYTIDKHAPDPPEENESGEEKWTVTINERAHGYRLPTEAEWEYAAGGGRLSGSYTYSGSDDINEVAWYWKNSGDKFLHGFWNYTIIEYNKGKTKPIGRKAPNELGLYDMSGNVREWCWDRHEPATAFDAPGRVWRGGGWLGGEQACGSSFRGSWHAAGKGSDTGFRLCRGE
ncbi:MAG: SUMF1/EgtB/PvdO family nonheme iron enzyme [Spirochaetales bacterium]|nr:SUMF1/EgtB/PvdO family nonheme iron enzyme [Spirochaetales bacterium]